MALKPEVLDALLAAGATAEMIVAAVKADMADDERRRDAKRAGDAERQRRSRSNRRPHRVSRDVTVTECDPPIDNNHTPPVSSDEETRARPKKSKSAMPAKPDEVSEQVWQDFTDLRRKKGGLSATALDGIRDEAQAAGWPLERALAECVTRNWQGFKAEWVRSSTAAPGKPQDGGSYLDFVVQKQQRQQGTRA